MNIDYHAHEQQYRKLRLKSDRTGWGSAREKREQIELFSEILHDINLPQNAQVLELGCGAAELAIHYARSGYRISGIDISQTAIEWGRQNAARAGVSIDLHCGDVRTLPFTDNSIDLALDACLLHCIIGEDRTKTLQEVHRVLKSGGFLAGITMCGPIQDVLRQQFDVVDDCLCMNGQAMRYIGDSDAILAELEAAGFSLIHHNLLEVEANGTLVYLVRKKG